jgi:HD-GYP domain-containing protein (c-di-GMP phosphodiesterase class II)
MNRQRRNSGLRCAEIMMALSLATDLGTGRPMEWAMRSALLGVWLGEALGFGDQELQDVYYSTLLLYIGCTSEADLALQMFGEDPATTIGSIDLIDKGNPRQMIPWMLKHFGAGHSPWQRLRTFANAGAVMSTFMRGHCEVAQQLAERLGMAPSIQHAFSQMYERWDGGGEPHHLKGEAIVRTMRLVLLVRDLEAYLYAHGAEAAIAVARERAGKVHDPEMVKRFCELASSYCTRLEEEASWEALLAIEPLPQFYSDEDFDNATLVIADFTDLLSPFFSGHSRSVATLAEAAAREYGLPQAQVKMVWRAALTHDVGKVAIPYGLWNRSRPLSNSEWERVRLHPYYSERILARPSALAQLGSMAACHHERLDGSGYHRSVGGELLSPSARLLAAANYYRARIEPRPNRAPLSPEAIVQQMRQEVRAGHLDGDAVNSVLKAAGHYTTPVRHARIAGLSEREIEVLQLIARSLSNRQMAQRLNISEKTVGTHILHIYDKIGCSTRSAATLFAMQHHLIVDAEYGR